jgi:hypothetical protein
MVTIDRINSDYTIYYDEQAQIYRAMCNKCCGSNADSTNISVDIYWVNGTAITDGAIDISWYTEYKP